jgi:hypothetical protein
MPDGHAHKEANLGTRWCLHCQRYVSKTYHKHD